MAVYECDQCGACCRQLRAEISPVDLAREPRLIQLGVRPLKAPSGCVSVEPDEDPDRDLGPLVPGFEYGARLTCGDGDPCPALDGNRCTIYPTRPGLCVAFRAGSWRCQRAREMEGLARLVPIAAPQRPKGRPPKSYLSPLPTGAKELKKPKSRPKKGGGP